MGVGDASLLMGVDFASLSRLQNDLEYGTRPHGGFFHIKTTPIVRPLQLPQHLVFRANQLRCFVQFNRCFMRLTTCFVQSTFCFMQPTICFVQSNRTANQLLGRASGALLLVLPGAIFGVLSLDSSRLMLMALQPNAPFFCPHSYDFWVSASLSGNDRMSCACCDIADSLDSCSGALLAAVCRVISDHLARCSGEANSRASLIAAVLCARCSGSSHQAREAVAIFALYSGRAMALACPFANHRAPLGVRKRNRGERDDDEGVHGEASSTK
jgi:hypothetical protein